MAELEVKSSEVPAVVENMRNHIQEIYGHRKLDDEELMEFLNGLEENDFNALMLYIDNFFESLNADDTAEAQEDAEPQLELEQAVENIQDYPQV